MHSSLPLLIIFVAAILSRNNLLGAAAAIVFFLDLMRLNRFFPLITQINAEKYNCKSARIYII